MMMLDRNENQYGPAPRCFDVIHAADLRSMSFYSRSYTKGTKGALAERLSSDLGIAEERVLLGYGSEDLLKQAVQSLLPRHGIMFLPAFSWWYYRRLAEEATGTSVLYPLIRENTTYRYDVGAIIGLYKRHRPQVILIASPNNPTGNAMRREEIGTLLAECPDAVIMLDEAYAGFEPPGEFHDVRRLLELSPRIVVLRTFSKYYALAGLRIGFACVGDDLHRFVSASARYLGYNRVSEEIALAALDSSGYYLRIATETASSKHRLITAFRDLADYTPYDSAANFLLIRHPEGDGNRIAAALKQRGIAVRFLEDHDLADCMRITVGTPEQTDAVISAFREIAASRPEVIPLPER